MQYLGSKHKIGKALAAYLHTRSAGRYFVEPFCGALNVTRHLTGPRIASDASPYLFSLYSALRSGWVPPDVLTEDTYRALKQRKDPTDPLTAFAGYGCSFGAKFFGGYARGGRDYSYAGAAKGSLLAKMAQCTEALFACCSYDALPFSPHQAVLYCDPPYANTTGYSAVGAFDSAKFWAWCQSQVRLGALVFVSEYSCPVHHQVVFEAKQKDGVGAIGAVKAEKVERLFEVLDTE